MNAKLIVPAILVSTACGGGSAQSLLDHATMLAVRAEPPRVDSGERAKIVALATAEDGTPMEIERPPIAAAGLPEEVAEQMLRVEEEGSFVVAPPAFALEQMREQLQLAPDAPIPLTLDLDLDISPIVQGATKVVLLGGRASNPRILEVAVDGVPAGGDRLVVAYGSQPKVSVRAEGKGELKYAWASSLGELEGYRSAEATMLAATAGRGHLVIVVRDPSGGVEWRIIDMEVQ
jgi:hypothetical protein